MELVLNEGVLVYIRLRALSTTQISSSPTKRPGATRISSILASAPPGKEMAIPPYPDWLSELTLIWGKEKVKVHSEIATPRRRQAEVQRRRAVISGEFRSWRI